MFWIQQIQLVLFALYITEQIVGRHITALRLLVICQGRDGFPLLPCSGMPQPHSQQCPVLPSSLPSLVMSVAEESSSTVSLRVSPLLRSSRDSLPSPWAISFRLKLGAGRADRWVGSSSPTL